MRNIYLFFGILVSVFFLGQNKDFEKKYKKFIDSFNSVFSQDKNEALKIINQMKSTDEYKKNDTLKILVKKFEIATQITHGNDQKIVNKLCNECIDFSVKNKLYSYASQCAHNKAVSYHYRDKIDSANIIDRQALEFAKLAKNETPYYIALVAIANRLSYLGKLKESNQLLVDNYNLIKDKETKAVALLYIARNYKDLGDKRSLDNYYLNSISSLKQIKKPKLLTDVIYEYCNYLIDRKDFNKSLIYSDSIIHFLNNEDNKAISKYIKSSSFYGLKDYDKALKYINEALIINKKIMMLILY